MSVAAAIERPRVAATLRASRTGAIAGVGFAVCLFLAVAMLEPPRGATDRELLAWWSDGGHQTTAVVSMYLFVAAGLCFLAFLVQLRARLLAAEGQTHDLTTLVVAAGTIFVSLLFIAAAARGVIGFAVKSPLHEESLPGPDTLRYVPQIGYAITGTGGMLAMALTMATTSWLIIRTAVFGRWLAWVGGAASLLVLVAVALLSGVFGIPAVLVWVLAVSAALWRRPVAGSRR